jgi:transcriptional regulator of heat shock response
MTHGKWGFVGVFLVWSGVACCAWAQSAPAVGGVYTCVDAKGRKLTADRPIAECTDREQKILNPSGTVQSRVGPTLTALERTALEQKAKKEAEELGRIGDEKRRDRALLIRYPNKGMHDQERAEALAQIAVVIKAASTRSDELARQRVAIDGEMEFYKKDPTKAPAYLRRQLEENIQSQAVQKRFIAEQEAEARRVNVRFDDELTRLRQLWTTIAK